MSSAIVSALHLLALAIGLPAVYLRGRALKGPLDADGFRAFAAPGYAKVVWDFRLTPEAGGTRLSTETRINCTDAASRRRFKLYRRIVGPFRGLIRIALLRAVAREATR